MLLNARLVSFSFYRTRALGVAKLVQGPQNVERYNGYRAAVVNGAAKPGFSSGQAAWRDGAPAGGDPAGGL